jgi:2-dehydropantoate 2-reductase
MIDASVLVVGGGAIGGVTAAKLTGAVRRVVVLDAAPEHVARLNAGLRLDELGEERTVPVEAVTEAPDERFDFALVTVKAAHHAQALARVDAECFVSLGNGLVQDRIAELVGGDRLIAGIVEWGATNLGPGHLAQTTRGPFVVGELDGPPRERTHRLAEVLSPAAECKVSDDIRSTIWTKLLVNSVFSGLGAVAGQTYAEVVADPHGRRAALDMWREGYDAGVAQGLTPGRVLGVEAKALAEGDEAALETAMQGHGATYASMLQDLERGVPTEVDVIVGAVVERGREHGVPTPLHEQVVELIHAAERGEREPSPDALARLQPAPDRGPVT